MLKRKDSNLITSFYCHGPDLGTIPSCLDYYNRIFTGSVSASNPASFWSIPHYSHLHHTVSHYIIIATVNLLKGKSNHYHSLLKTSLALHVTQNKSQKAYHDLWSSAWSGLLFSSLTSSLRSFVIPPWTYVMFPPPGPPPPTTRLWEHWSSLCLEKLSPQYCQLPSFL